MRSLRRLTLLAAVLSSAIGVTLAQTTTPTTSPSTTPSAVSWDKAAQHVGETVTVTGPVISTYTMDDSQVILNVGKAYPEPDRFSILMAVPANSPDPDATYAGKTVTVTGKIEKPEETATIHCKAADVTVQK